MTKMPIARATLALAFLAACTPSQPPADRTQPPAAPAPAPPTADPAPAPTDGSAAAAPAPAEPDTGTLARLEREARALAHAEGCTAGQCRTAPVGRRPCGGPREYIVYCAARTDSAALFAKLAELARAEDAYNRANQLASTCEMRMPPGVTLSGGRCTAAPSNELPPQ